MCISAEASLKSFFSTIIFIGLLLKFGLKKMQKFNLYFSLSSFYVILMQLIDYFIWVDLDCKKGFNKIATKLAPLLLFTQPLIMYLVGRKIFPEKKVPNSISIINILYFIYFIVNVIRNWNKNSCTGILEETGHLLWKWKWQPLGYFYLILIVINFSFYANHFYGITALGITLLLLLLMMIFRKENSGELWCFSAAAIPGIILVLQLYKKFIK
jgi:hypothetical protein